AMKRFHLTSLAALLALALILSLLFATPKGRAFHEPDSNQPQRTTNGKTDRPTTGFADLKALMDRGNAIPKGHSWTLSPAVASVCTPPPSNLVSWYRAEGNFTDFQDGNNGTQSGGVAFAP